MGKIANCGKNPLVKKMEILKIINNKNCGKFSKKIKNKFEKITEKKLI